MPLSEAANARIHKISAIDYLGISRRIPLFVGVDISAIIGGFLKESTVGQRAFRTIPRDRRPDDAQRLV
jgi:hypothetical protein